MLRIFPASIAFIALTACEPPYSIQVTEFNEKGFQQPAAITISDPQVFSRESLINDRFREAELLDQLLTESASEGFKAKLSTPQLLRNVETLTGIAAQGALKFDPTAGRSAEAVEELDEKKLANDKLRLDIIEAQLEAIQSKVDRGEELTEKEQATLLAPSIISLLRNPHFPDRIHTRHALSDKHINLPKLLNNLFRFVPLVRHSPSSVSYT